MEYPRIFRTRMDRRAIEGSAGARFTQDDEERILANRLQSTIRGYWNDTDTTPDFDENGSIAPEFLYEVDWSDRERGTRVSDLYRHPVFDYIRERQYGPNWRYHFPWITRKEPPAIPDPITEYMMGRTTVVPEIFRGLVDDTPEPSSSYRHLFSTTLSGLLPETPLSSTYLSSRPSSSSTPLPARVTPPAVTPRSSTYNHSTPQQSTPYVFGWTPQASEALMTPFELLNGYPPPTSPSEQRNNYFSVPPEPEHEDISPIEQSTELEDISFEPSTSILDDEAPQNPQPSSSTSAPFASVRYLPSSRHGSSKLRYSTSDFNIFSAPEPGDRGVPPLIQKAQSQEFAIPSNEVDAALPEISTGEGDESNPFVISDSDEENIQTSQFANQYIADSDNDYSYSQDVEVNQYYSSDENQAQDDANVQDELMEDDEDEYEEDDLEFNLGNLLRNVLKRNLDRRRATTPAPGATAYAQTSSMYSYYQPPRYMGRGTLWAQERPIDWTWSWANPPAFRIGPLFSHFFYGRYYSHPLRRTEDPLPIPEILYRTIPGWIPPPRRPFPLPPPPPHPALLWPRPSDGPSNELFENVGGSPSLEEHDPLFSDPEDDMEEVIISNLQAEEAVQPQLGETLANGGSAIGDREMIDLTPDGSDNDILGKVDVDFQTIAESETSNTRPVANCLSEGKDVEEELDDQEVPVAFPLEDEPDLVEQPLDERPLSVLELTTPAQGENVSPTSRSQSPAALPLAEPRLDEEPKAQPTRRKRSAIGKRELQSLGIETDAVLPTRTRSARGLRGTGSTSVDSASDHGSRTNSNGSSRKGGVSRKTSSNKRKRAMPIDGDDVEDTAGRRTIKKRRTMDDVPGNDLATLDEVSSTESEKEKPSVDPVHSMAEASSLLGLPLLAPPQDQEDAPLAAELENVPTPARPMVRRRGKASKLNNGSKAYIPSPDSSDDSEENEYEFVGSGSRKRKRSPKVEERSPLIEDEAPLSPANLDTDSGRIRNKTRKSQRRKTSSRQEGTEVSSTTLPTSQASDYPEANTISVSQSESTTIANRPGWGVPSSLRDLWNRSLAAVAPTVTTNGAEPSDITYNQVDDDRMDLD